MNRVLRITIAALERRDVALQQDDTAPDSIKLLSELAVRLGQMLEESDRANEADELCRSILPETLCESFEAQEIYERVKVMSARKASQH